VVHGPLNNYVAFNSTWIVIMDVMKYELTNGITRFSAPIAMTKHLDNNTKCFEVLLCYDLMEGVTNK
jgi:hypothetical protein